MDNKKLIFLLFISTTGFADNKTSLITIPKCGNFLLLKLMEMISHKKDVHSSPYNPELDWEKAFTITHEKVQDKTISFCREKDIKVIFIYRDPRDQVVSAAYYLKKIGWPPSEKFTISELITSLIVDSYKWWWKVTGQPGAKGTITDFYNFMMPWALLDFVYPTTFEKLVGSRGGGDDLRQLQEIKNIAQFAGYHLTQEEAEHIASTLWGRNTFREGKIGAWKEEFTLEQKNLFKKVAGQLLIDLGYETDLNW